MKTILLILVAWILVAWNDARADTVVMQCVYPAVVPTKIVVYANPVGEAKSENKVGYFAYKVGAEQNKRIAIWSVPDYSKEDPFELSDRFIGWVEKSQFELQDLRNCT